MKADEAKTRIAAAIERFYAQPPEKREGKRRKWQRKNYRRKALDAEEKNNGTV